MLFAVDWIEIVIFLFIVVSSLIGQAVKVVQERNAQQKKKAKRAAPPPVARPDQPPQAAVPNQPPRDKKSALEAEIEDFLKRSRGQQNPQRAPEQAEQRPRPLQQPPARQPVRAEIARPENRPGQQQRPKPRRATPAAPARPRPPELTPDDIATPPLTLRERLAQSDRERGAEIGLADERMESHLRHYFDHTVGEIAAPLDMQPIAEGTDASVWDARTTTANPLAKQVVEMLSNPAQVQSVILASEILRRPSERWE